MDQQILCLSGRKQSGKNTTVNLLYGLTMQELGLIDHFDVNERGRLVAPINFSGEVEDRELDLENPSEPLREMLELYVWPEFKPYSFADALKEEVCIKILGLTREQCYGTDEQKSSLTHLLWENMPGVTTVKTPKAKVDAEVAGRLGKYYEKLLSGLVYHEPGPMTAREVMQYVGTEIFRKMYGNVWVDATVRKIRAEGTKRVVISDGRFPNEIDGVHEVGGKSLRYLRSPLEDTHDSEHALDDYTGYSFTMDNSNMSVGEQCMSTIEQVIKPLGWFAFVGKTEEVAV